VLYGYEMPVQATLDIYVVYTYKIKIAIKIWGQADLLIKFDFNALQKRKWSKKTVRVGANAPEGRSPAPMGLGIQLLTTAMFTLVRATPTHNQEISGQGYF
jgi:hypothetical protein